MARPIGEQMRTLATAGMAVAGLTLLSIAALDWVSYTGFTFSLLWWAAR